METKQSLSLVASLARIALPLAVAAWCLFIVTLFALPIHDEQRRAIHLVLIVALALVSAISAMHVVLRGERHWTRLLAFGLSAGLLASWFVLILLTGAGS